jgi:hypothetical protein
MKPETVTGLIDAAEQMRQTVLDVIKALSWIMRPPERDRLQTVADELGKAIDRFRADVLDREV